MSTPTLMLDTVDSTMAEAERQAESGRTGPLVVCARTQTGGTGRHGRDWASPPGNLYWTMLLDAEADRALDAGLAFAAGLAVMDALADRGVPSARLGLKWPNDVLLDGRKIAGVLARSTLTGSARRTVVGIGVNLCVAPSGTAYPATSMAESGLPPPPVEAIRDALTAAFLARRADWHRLGLTGVRDAVAERLQGVGEPVRIALDRDRTQLLTGMHEGISADGALCLRTKDGVLHELVAGDVLA